MFHKYRTTQYVIHSYRVNGPVRVGGATPELYVSELGRFFSTGRFVFEQVSPGHIVHVVESGEGVMEMDEKPYKVGAGDAFTFFPRRHFFYHDTPKTPWRYTWFRLEGKQARMALQHAGVTEAEPLSHGNLAETLEPIFKEIVRVYEQPDVPPSFAVAAAWRLIDALAGTRSTPASSSPVGTAEAARFLMDHHYMETLSVEGIAKQLQVSRSTLFRKFYDAYRVSPKDYLDSVRIEQARKLLRQSRSSIKEIATACGYESAHYFSRAFKKRSGHAPRHWKQKEQQAPAKAQ